MAIFELKIFVTKTITLEVMTNWRQRNKKIYFCTLNSVLTYSEIFITFYPENTNKSFFFFFFSYKAKDTNSKIDK